MTEESWTSFLEQQRDDEVELDLQLYGEPEIDSNITPNYGGELNYD